MKRGDADSGSLSDLSEISELSEEEEESKDVAEHLDAYGIYAAAVPYHHVTREPSSLDRRGAHHVSLGTLEGDTLVIVSRDEAERTASQPERRREPREFATVDADGGEVPEFMTFSALEKEVEDAIRGSPPVPSCRQLDMAATLEWASGHRLSPEARGIELLLPLYALYEQVSLSPNATGPLVRSVAWRVCRGVGPQKGDRFSPFSRGSRDLSRVCEVSNLREVPLISSGTRKLISRLEFSRREWTRSLTHFVVCELTR